MNPHVTNILNEVEARLGNITAENGYLIGLKKIARAKLTPFKGYDLPTANFWPTRVSSDQVDYGLDSRSLDLLIEVHSKTMDKPFVDICDQLAADLVTGLNRDTTAPRSDDSEDPDLGGLVSGFIFTGYDYQIGEGQAPWCGILAQFTVKYDAPINDLFTHTP